MMPVLVVLAIFVAIYSMTRPGAFEGVKYFLIPNFETFSWMTVVGLEYIGKPVRTVQFHPEANAGPKDSELLFDEFMKMIGGNK